METLEQKLARGAGRMKYYQVRHRLNDQEAPYAMLWAKNTRLAWKNFVRLCELSKPDRDDFIILEV